MHPTKNLLLTLALMAAASTIARAESPPAIKVDRLKIATSMLGDAQLWTDHCILSDGCRLQNKTGDIAWRVLDSSEKVIQRGPREKCETQLLKLAKKRPVAVKPKELVVLLHGLFQTRAKMTTLEKHLEASGQFEVYNFGYASTKADIDAHAKALEEVLAKVDPGRRVSFVGHSMGGIVARQYLANHRPEGVTIGRLVMIGPPNQGAEMARRFREIRFVRSMLGPGFEQLAEPKEAALMDIPAPRCEFALIAGASPKWLLNNPLIEGDDDWIVGVEETSLKGAKATALVHSHHGEIVHNPRVLELTTQFLKTGELAANHAKDAK
jgi:pimeloyl-ACP methyl ester carboxylesterase